MKKKQLVGLSAMALVFAFVALQPVAAQSVTPPDEDFEVVQNKDGKTLTISNYKGSAKNIIIPANLYGLPVTVIGGRAFTDKGLTGVVIPDSVTTIEGSTNAGAFEYNRLTNIIIPDSVTTIGMAAFGKNQLTSVTLGKNVTIINAGVFGMNQLTNITIPDSVTFIGMWAFAENQLTSVTWGKNVTIIAMDAFSSNRLTSLTIPDSVTSISDSAFEGNPLTSLILGKGLTSIGDRAFYGNQLTNITIAKDVYKGVSTGVGFEQSFINFYESQKRSPGTYVKNGPIWSKQ